MNAKSNLNNGFFFYTFNNFWMAHGKHEFEMKMKCLINTLYMYIILLLTGIR